MKKRVIFIVVTALLCCLLCAVRFEDAASSAPKHKAERSFSVWDEVKNAEGYIVLADNEEYVTAEPSCNLSFLGGGDRLRRKDKGSGRRRKFCRLRLV